jgi:hypothetical protein
MVLHPLCGEVPASRAARKRPILHPDRRLRNQLEARGAVFWQIYDSRSRQYLAGAASLRERVRNEVLLTAGTTPAVLLIL